MDDTSWMIPEEIKNELAMLAANFHRSHMGVSVDDITKFMGNTVKIYAEYLSIMEEQDKIKH